MRTLEEARQYEVERKKREVDVKTKKHRDGASYLFETGRSGESTKGSSSSSSSTAGGSGGAVVAASTTQATRRVLVRRPLDDDGEDTQATTTTTIADSKTKALMFQAPGAELLSAKEMEFCIALPILPLHFIAVKEAVVRYVHYVCVYGMKLILYASLHTVYYCT